MPEVVYLLREGGTITADSIPDLDSWGWDSFWGCDEWVMWHKANKAKYGANVAGEKFAEYWNKQTMGAHALDCRTIDSSFRDYIERNGLHDVVWESAGWFAPILDTSGKGFDTVKKGGKVLKWVLIGGASALVIYGGYQIFKPKT